MSETETRMSQVARVSLSASNDAQKFKVLYERLLREQPESASLLQRLLSRSRRNGADGVFAVIDNNRCSACNMTVASAQLQKASGGKFISCAHCAVFLYHDQR
jgi:hypothetical protein